MSQTSYAPTSHFFVEHDKLSPVNSPDENSALYRTDAFGPVAKIEGGVTTYPKYRTTSVVRENNPTSTSKVKVFAICDGQILLQPQTGSTDKINLILKPTASYAPLKIKYFIYRGVNKADLLTINNGRTVFKPISETDSSQPAFFRRLWEKYISLNQSCGLPPSIFYADLVGYEENMPLTTLLDSFFYKVEDCNYQIPTCFMGEHLGYFSGDIGLDIVLDDGDYTLEQHDALFKFDLAFARAKNHCFDITLASLNLEIKKKRYKEHIHQFLDAAAFWGSHIDCGFLKFQNEPSILKTASDIYGRVLNKYQTQSKVYIYIQGDNNRSFNYYDMDRKVYFDFDSTGEKNETAGWPIKNKYFSFPRSTEQKCKKYIQLNYNIDPSINTMESQVSFDTISPCVIYLRANTDYIFSFNPAHPSWITGLIYLEIPITPSGTELCSTFLFVYANLKQKFPIEDYFNNLWIPNIKPNIQIPLNREDSVLWCMYDKNRVINLNEPLGIGAASIQNKVLFDSVKVGTTIKNRRLYMAVIKRSSVPDLERKNFDIDKTLPVATEIKMGNNENYSQLLYNDNKFSIYKGTFTNNNETINSLVLFHENSIAKKNSYFQLGIMEDEYERLINENTVSLTNSENLFFYLQEDFMFNHDDVRKFELGLSYENSNGDIDGPIFSSSSPIHVYTIDGLFFFSKEYSASQPFYKEFAKAKVEFRPVPKTSPNKYPGIPIYDGEFGFDWLRVNDNHTAFNNDMAYKNIIIGGYRKKYFHLDTNEATSGEAFKLLKKEYYALPTQKNNDLYIAPYLNLFSKELNERFRNENLPKPYNPLFEANLRILVEIEETLGKLEFDYNPEYFKVTINRTDNPDNNILTDKNTHVKQDGIDKTVKITCLKDFSETKQIKVLAYPANVHDKKQAKLAGLIVLNRNDEFRRRELKFVFVKVQTKIDIGTASYEEGKDIDNEKDYLIKTMAQCFILATVEESSNMLNLMSDAKFKRGRGYVDSIGRITHRKNVDNCSVFQYLKSLFFAMQDTSNNLINKKYEDHITVFVFALPGTPDPNEEKMYSAGGVEDIGVLNLILFQNGIGREGYRDQKVFSHEALHGLGLWHTHNDGAINPHKKYVYPLYNDNEEAGTIHVDDATDNHMSYADDKRKFTWNWQWKIINKLKRKTT